ncbi:MAG TPA: hypothetical protein VGZ23_07450 [bacterium]|nr:hypothetical protein [bacterium]
MAAPAQPTSSRLPSQLTSFIGREREVAEVKRLVLGNRLVTLTGAGGCGKTRLALQVAGDLLDEFPDEVWMADLAPLSNAAFVPNVIAAVLGFPEQPGRSLQDTLAESLRPRVLLLLLDNCERVWRARRLRRKTTAGRPACLARPNRSLGVYG